MVKIVVIGGEAATITTILTCLCAGSTVIFPTNCALYSLILYLQWLLGLIHGEKFYLKKKTTLFLMSSPFWSSFPYLLSLFVIFFCIISLSHLSICHFSPQHLLVIFAPDLSVCHSPSFIYLGYFLSCHFSISHFSHVICILVITPSPLPLSLYWFFLHIISLTVNPSIIILSASPPSSSY